MSNANKIKIDIQNVTFSYSDSREPVLKDVSLQIRANEITVIFGPGMGGKSTLLRLLNRLNDLLEGNDMRGQICLLYTSPSPRDRTRSRMPSSA